MIQSLHLKRFKSFLDATLHLGPLTVLIGANASGKSNIRDAFRFLHGIGMHYRLPEILGEAYYGNARIWDGIRGGKREIAYTGSDSFELGLAIRARPDGQDVLDLDYRIEVGVGPSATSPPRLVREALYAGDRTVFRIGDGEAGDDRISVAPGSLVDRNGQNGPIVFSPDTPVIAQAEDLIARYDEHRSASLALKELRDIRFLDPTPDRMRIPSLPGHRALGAQGENLSSVLAAICGEPGRERVILEWIRKLTPMDVDRITFDQDAAGRILLRLIEKDGRSVSALSASDGTLRFLGYLAALFEPGPGSLYFIEELENGIHPTRLSLLVDLLERQARRRGIQVVATSHSPELLQFLSEESLENASLVYRLSDQPDSRIKRLLEIPNATRVIKEQPISLLHASNWFEDMLDFAEDAEGEPTAETQPAA